MTSACDVLVLGAGPAGAATAVHLARAGFDVVLADRKAFPRDKPCGEFLGPECRPYLAELGVDEALLAAGTRRIHGMQLCCEGQRAAGHFRALPGRPYADRGYAVRREVLDLHLLEAARARPEVRWLERHEFVGLQRDAGGVVTGARLRDAERREVAVAARWVVGADGVRSRVAQQLGWQRPVAWLDRMALVGRYRGVVPQELAEVHFVRGGYFAATTVDDGSFHLNLVVDRTRVPGASELDAFVAAHVQDAPMLQERLRSAVRAAPWRGTGPLAFTTRQQAAPGVALVGDACGYVDPLTGEGIFFALHGARTLAQALAAARSVPRRAAAALRAYERGRRREVAPRLCLARLLQRGVRREGLARSCLRMLAAHPRWCDLLVALTGDALHPRDLLRPSFWRHWRSAPA